ncbi:MAG: hypothetical protein ACLTNO_10845 [Blautia sp.]
MKQKHIAGIALQWRLGLACECQVSDLKKERKMKRRIAAIVLGMAMMTTLLGGCGE